MFNSKPDSSIPRLVRIAIRGVVIGSLSTILALATPAGPSATDFPNLNCRQTLSIGGVGNTVGLVVEDFNNDGLDDIAMASSLDTLAVVYKNLGNGKLVKAQSLRLAFTTATNPGYTAEDGDFDGDGDPDLAVTNYAVAPAELRIFWNNGAGVFSNGPLVTIDSDLGFAFYPEAANYDSDPAEEMVITAVSNSTSGRLYYLNYNAGTGSFDSPHQLGGNYENFGTSYTPTDVFAGDLNADGLTDFVLGGGGPHPTAGPSFIEVWLNTGNPSPAPFGSTYTQRVEFGYNVLEVAIMKVNSDNLWDIIATDMDFGGQAASRKKWYYFLNTGTASSPNFATATGVPDPGRRLWGVDFGTYVGGDNLVDVAVARNDGKSIAIWRNTGSSGAYFSFEDSLLAIDAFEIPTLLQITQLHSGGDVEVIYTGGKKATRVYTLDSDACMCDCHGDPVCDGIHNIQDFLKVQAAAQGSLVITDPNSCCPRTDTDLDCNGVTNGVDVTKMQNVYSGGADPCTEFCLPCTGEPCSPY